MKKELRRSILLTLMMGIISLSSCTTTRESEVEDELGEFRSWVSRKTSQIANRTEEDWKRAKEDFQVRTQELDQKQEHFTDELKEEYQQLKEEFEQADETYMKAQSEARLSEWERKLLGRWADMATINETSVLDAYTTFMENVRTMKSNWTNQEWDMAKLVMQELDDRKNQITANIDTETEVRIKALQMEFRTLETAADVVGS